jgi:hypothetical protein
MITSIVQFIAQTSGHLGQMTLPSRQYKVGGLQINDNS